MTRHDIVRFDVLDSLRGIAALGVALFHVQLVNPVTNSTFINNSWLLVDLFFVLSGFILSHTYFFGRTPDFRSFVSARLARLYPLHLYTLLVYVVFETLKKIAIDTGLLTFNSPPFGDNNAVSFLDNLLMFDSFALLGDKITWNYPSWSISAEFWSNLVFAALIIALALRRPAGFVTLAATAMLASGGWLLLSGSGLETSGELGIVRCAFGFSIGMITYALYAALRERRLAAPHLLEAAAITVFALAVLTVRDIDPIFAPFGFGFVILVFAREAGFVSSLLCRKPFAYFGRISYSIYLNHAIVAVIVQKLAAMLLPADNVAASLAATIVYLAIVIGYSHLTYRLIEAPWRRRLKAWLPAHADRRQQRTSIASSVTPDGNRTRS